MVSQAELQIVISARNEAEKVLRGLGGSLGAAQKAADTAKGAFGSLGGAVAGATKALGSIGLASVGIQAVAGAAQSLGGALGVGLASELEGVKAQFLAFTKSAEVTDQILADLRREAASTPFAFREMASAAASLLPASKQAGVGLNDLIKQAEILAALNPGEGLEGAAFALKEALGGDFVSIVERFNLPRQRLNELKEQGVPAMEAVSIALREMGADASLVSNLAGTTAGRLSSFRDGIDSLRLAAGKPILAALGTQLDRLAAFIAENEEALTALATAIGSGIARAVEVGAQAVMAFRRTFEGALPALRSIVDFVGDHLGPILAGLAATLATVVVPAFLAWASTAAAAAAATVVALAPVLLPVAAIGAAVALLAKAWESNFLGIQDATAAAWEVIRPVFEAIVAALSAFWTEIQPEFTKAWDAMRAGAQDAWEALWRFLKPALDLFERVWVEHWDTTKRVLDLAWDAIQGVVEAGWELVKGVIRAGLRLLQGDWEGAWQAITAALGTAWDALRGVVDRGIGLLTEALAHAWDAIKGVAAAAWAGIRDTITGIFAGIVGPIQGVINQVLGLIAPVQQAIERITSFRPPDLSGVLNQIGQVQAQASRAAETAAGAAASLASGGGGSGFDWGAYNFARNTGATEAEARARAEGRAMGGPVAAGVPYVVGERGQPEWFVPATNGALLPQDIIAKVLGMAAGGGMAGGAARGQNIMVTVPVYLDGAEIARVTAAPMQSEQNRLVRLAAV